jgi:hypothetical protein
MKKYRKICEEFIKEYFNIRRQQMLDGLDVETPNWIGEQIAEAPLNTTLGRLTVRLAKAAAGNLPVTQKDGMLADIETLFAFLSTPAVPDSGRLAFLNASDFGRMVRDAHLWATGDRLLTQAEAAEIANVTPRAIGLRIESGHLSLYLDSDEPDTRKRRRVSFLEVSALAAEIAERKAKQLPSPDELVVEYNADESVTLASLAKKYGFSQPTILKRMKGSSVERRQPTRGRRRG